MRRWFLLGNGSSVLHLMNTFTRYVLTAWMEDSHACGFSSFATCPSLEVSHGFNNNNKRKTAKAIL